MQPHWLQWPHLNLDTRIQQMGERLRIKWERPAGVGPGTPLLKGQQLESAILAKTLSETREVLTTLGQFLVIILILILTEKAMRLRKPSVHLKSD